MYITQNPFFHGMLSLLVARFQSLKLLETGSRNKLFQLGEQGQGTSETGWVSWEEIQPDLGMLGLQSCN